MTATRPLPGVLVAMVAALLVAGVVLAVSRNGETNETIDVRIVSPADGATRRGNVVEIGVASSGVLISRATRGNRPIAHYHVFVDRDPVAPGKEIPKDPDIVHFMGKITEVTGLSVGSHRFAVVLAGNDEIRLGKAQAEVVVKVAGPSVVLAVPATAPANAPIEVGLKVSGVQLVPPDGKNDSADRAHVVVLVDQKPPSPGEPFPIEGVIHTVASSVRIGPLSPGRHRIVAFLALGNNNRYRPRATSSAVVNVG